ncbi:ABC transporter substrate-binding protein [Chloroflexota bacterium]
MAMKKIIWILVSCLMALSLVMASCNGGAVEEEEEEEEEVITEEEEEEEEEEEVVASGEPEYGGILTLGLPDDIRYFTSIGHAFIGATFAQTNQTLIEGDWSRGPAGTNEFDWAKMGYGSWDIMTGMLVESWEIPEIGTVIFNIRQGVHFSLDPNNAASRLVNGREFTAYDAAAIYELLRTVRGSAPSYGNMVVSTNTALDKWTFETKIAPEIFDGLRTTPMYCPLGAPELYEQGWDLKDWRNAVGTGPFILTDFVSGSSATLVRNPNYWETDPAGPGKGNQLPYVDGVKLLIIPDLSTRLSALRTGKVDILNNVAWEDAELLMKANSDLLYKKFYSDARHCIAMRTDKPELPYSDKNVRRALMMATDFETIRDTWGGGEAQILTWPIHYTKEEAPSYLGLDDPEMPDSVKELYVYNTDKAMQLLDDAGYPDGFSTKVTCANFPADVDYLSIIKDQWSKVNVELTIESLEPGAFTSVRANRLHEEMIHQGGGPLANLFLAAPFYGITRAGNLSYLDDPVVATEKAKWDPLTLTDPATCMVIHKELMKYVLDQAWAIPGVNPPQRHLWWPWVNNYHGEYGMGRSIMVYTKYVWMDTDMKKSMGY